MGFWTVNMGVASVGYVFGNLLPAQRRWQTGKNEDYFV